MAFLLLQYNLLLLLLSIGVQEELKELGLWKFAGGIMYIMQEVFGMPASRLIVPLSEKYGKFMLNEVLETGNFGMPASSESVWKNATWA